MGITSELLDMAEDIKLPQDSYDLTSDRVFDATFLGSKLREAHVAGELSDVMPELSTDTQEILSRLSYIEDEELFYEDYSKLPIDERNKLKDGIFKREKEDVVSMSAQQAAKQLEETYNLDDAKKFTEQYVKYLKNADKYENSDFVKAMYSIEDKNFNDAMKVFDMNKSYSGLVQKFNAQWLLNNVSKTGIQLPDLMGLKARFEKGKFQLDLTQADWWQDEDDDEKAAALANLEKGELRNFSDVAMVDVVKSKEDLINYWAARNNYFRLNGYPSDFQYDPVLGTADQYDPKTGKVVKDGVEKVYPIQSGLLAATGAGLAGSKLGRLPWFAAGTFMDAPLMFGMEGLMEDLNDTHPALAAGATLVTALVLAPLSEAGAAKLISGVSKVGKNVMVKPGSAMLNQIKSIGGLDNVRMSEDMYDNIFGAITTPKADPTGLLQGDRQMHKIIPSDMTDGEKLYITPQTEFPYKEIDAIKIDADNVDLARSALKQTEQTYAKTKIKDGLEERLFDGSYKDEIAKILKADPDNVKGAMKLVNQHLDEAYHMSRGIMDNTKSYIPEHDASWLHNEFTGLAGPALKETLERKPYALQQAVAAVNKDMYDVINHIDSGFGLLGGKHKRKFNELVELADSNDIDLSKLVGTGQIHPKVEKALAQYRIFNDEAYKIFNRQYSRILNESGVKQLGDDLVEVLDEATGQMRNIKTGDVFTGDMSEIGKVTKAIKYVPNYFHRKVKANTVTLSVMDAKSGIPKVVDTFPSHKEAIKVAKDQYKGKKTVIHRMRDDVKRDTVAGRYSAIQGHKAGELSGEADSLIHAINDLHLVDVPKSMIDDILENVKSTYGIKDLSKVKNPYTILKKVRTREKSLTYGLESPLESAKSYTRMMTQGIVERPYIQNLKAEFIKKYGNLLENPKDYLSKLKPNPDIQDDTGMIFRSAKAVQNKIMNLERVPSPHEIAVANTMDRWIHNLYSSNNGAKRALGQLLEVGNKYAPISTKSARDVGYFSALACRMQQLWLQGSFGHFGMFAHMGKVNQLDLLPNTIAMAQYFGLKNNKYLSKFALATKGQKEVIKEIENAGYLDDLLGTEGGSGKGLLGSTVSMAMSPVKWGEACNRLININLAMKMAKKEGLKMGTHAHRQYVSTYYSKYSQILNHTTSGKLSSSMWTSWNVGMFKKFQLQWMDQFWYGLSRKQKIAYGAFGYSMYGLAGIPGSSEVGELITAADQFQKGQAANQAMQAMAYSTETHEKELFGDIEDVLHDQPELVSRLKKEYKGSKKELDKIMGDMDNMSLTEFIGKDELDQMTNDQGFDSVIMKMINHEGLMKNTAFNIGWASMLKQVRSYGIGSLAGPYAQILQDVRFGNAYSQTAAVLSATRGDEMDPRISVPVEHMNRLYHSVARGAANVSDAFMSFSKMSGAINDQTLVDENGNKLGWVDIFENPTMQVNIPYEGQGRFLGTRVSTPTSSAWDITMKALGTKSGRVQNIQQTREYVMNHTKYVVEPTAKNYAELCYYLHDKGDHKLANNIRFAYGKFIMEKYSHVPLYAEHAHKLFENHTQKIEFSNGFGGSFRGAIRQRDMEKMVNDLKEIF